MRFQRSQGISLSPKGGAAASVEDIESHMAQITDFTQSTYPTSPADALRDMISSQGLSYAWVLCKLLSLRMFQANC